jgi:hypothetical protein
MPTEISWDIRERAEGAYIIDGLTYEQVAALTGVSVTQLKRWGANGEWAERKREYRRELSDIRRGTVQLRAKLLRKVLDAPSPDPQEVYAFARIEQVAAAMSGRGGDKPAAAGVHETAEPREIRTPEDAIDALDDALKKKINGLLASPDGVNLAGVRDIKQCLELLDKMRSQIVITDKTRDKGVDAATIAAIREQLRF